VGGLTLAYNLGLRIFGVDAALWRLWPLAAMSLSLVLMAPAIFARGQRGAGALFIPALPILAVAGIGMFSNVAGSGLGWAAFWPQMLVSLALGLGLAAYFMRAVWLVLPALVLGLTGMALQFSALTGWWGAWAVLWAVAPLAVGLSLLIIGRARRSGGLVLAGLIMCGSIGALALGLTAVLFGLWGLASAAGGVGLIVAGAGLLAWQFRASRARATAVVAG
jgi:hypothetical protein